MKDPNNIPKHFGIGDRVEMTPEAIATGLDIGGIKTGIVKKVRLQNPDMIGVQRDGRKTIERYHKSFWKVVPLILCLACLAPTTRHGGQILMEMARGNVRPQATMTNKPAISIMPPVITNAPRAIVRPPSTNWIVTPFDWVPSGDPPYLYRLDKSTNGGKTWTLIRSNMVGGASTKTTNYDVWDADRLPNVWYRLDRQTRFFRFTIP